MTLKVVTAPEHYRKPFHIFLAGGITGTSNWQKTAIEILSHTMQSFPREVVIFNPRREHWDLSDEETVEEQIMWEHNYLMFSDAHIFWFPPETLCPITLYEIGKVAQQGKPLFVGCHPDYQRRKDVIIQMELVRRDVQVKDSLKSTLADIQMRCVYM